MNRLLLVTCLLGLQPPAAAHAADSLEAEVDQLVASYGVTEQTPGVAPSKTQDGETNSYGFGWTIYPNDSGGLNGFGHEGSWGGFRTSYYNYVAAGRTTVVLSNRGNFDTDKFWYVLDAVIEKHDTSR